MHNVLSMFSIKNESAERCQKDTFGRNKKRSKQCIQSIWALCKIRNQVGCRAQNGIKSKPLGDLKTQTLWPEGRAQMCLERILVCKWRVIKDGPSGIREGREHSKTNSPQKAILGVFLERQAGLAQTI